MKINLNEQLHEEATRLLQNGQYEQVLPLFHELAAYYKACEDYDNYVKVKISIIICYFNLERVRFVDEHISDIEPYEALLSEKDRHRYYMAQATLFYFWHDMEQCIQMYEKCLRLSFKLERSFLLTTAGNFATIYRMLDRYEESFEVLNKALAYLPDMDLENPHIRYGLVELYLSFTANYTMMGDYENARRYLAELESLNFILPDSAQLNTYKRWKSLALYESGFVEEGFALFSEEFKVMKARKDYRLHTWHLKKWVEYAVAHERYKEAYEYTAVLNESLEKNLEEALLERSSKYAAELKTNDLRNLAFEDPMTSLHNRRLLTKLEKQYEQEPRMLTVVTLDIDHFKQINDTYGHGIGDDLLIEVANTIQRTMYHPQHHCIRFGGDEFIVVLERPVDEAAAWVKRLHETLTETAVELDDVTIQPKCSIGVADGQHIALQQLTKIADERLYKAKANGRNCIVGL